ncbi:MAG: hypothetical protein U0324_21810 [Polyangiales bacterium]
MPTPNFRRALVVAAAVALPVAVAPGCAEERPAINRVQPDFLDKRDLIPAQYAQLVAGAQPGAVSEATLAREPAYYTQTTLIAKPTTTGFVGLTSYSELQKVRWEVTERALIARSAQRYVRNAPGGQGGIGQNPRTGEIVAAFAITSHFDAVYDYNPTTGEPANVLLENTTDRPWYQRQYMRVDWSRNLIEGYNSVLEFEEWEGKVEAEPVPVFVNSPDDPNAPQFEYATRQGHRELRYFDVVNRAIVHPERVDLGDNFRIPVCWLGSGEQACNPAELTFRVSFLRADPTRDYETASLTRALPGATNPPRSLDMDRFGSFDTLRMGYDRANSAILDTQRLHLATRHNLWTRHHAPVLGAPTSALCNRDSDCADGSACRIGSRPADASHRGACAPWGVAHLAAASEARCATDDDCRYGANAISATAACDAATHTCGERYVRCSADADCAQVDPQSTCDLAAAYTRPDNRGLCLLPFRQRQVRRVVYHESANYPASMQPVTDAVVRDWNLAFAEAVRAARRHECEVERNLDPSTTALATNPCNTPEVTGTDPRFGADAVNVYVGCHAPVWGTDASKPGAHTQAEVDAARAAGWDLPECGPQGTVARLGDLRYNMIGSITDHDAQGYWGLANIAADPDTGEIIAGRGAVWQTVTENYAAWLVTLVRLLSGEGVPTDIANGRYLVDSMRQIGSGRTASTEFLDAPFRGAGALGELASVTGPSLERFRAEGAGWFTPGAGRTLRSHDPDVPGAFELAARRLRQTRALGDGSNTGNDRRLALRNTDIESRLLNDMQARLAPTAEPDPSASLPLTREFASPLRGQNPAQRRAVRRLRQQLSAWQCDHEAAFGDDVLQGLANRIATGGPIRQSDPVDRPVAYGRDWTFRRADGTVDYELVHTYALQFIHQGVLAHELGHAVGQRHNFSASADAINYNDRYWEVRGRGHARGLRPRYEYLSDPADGNYYSQEEIDGRVEEFSYSSVMDYKGLNEDAHGLGRYDRAFVRHNYAGLVEAFRRVADRDRAIVYSINTAGGGSSTPLDLRDWARGGPPHGVHYTQIPEIFGRRDDGTPDVREDNRYDVFLRETRSTPIAGWGDPDFTNVTADGHVLVPYRFDSDERAGLIWENQTNDAGADAFESMHYVASRYIDYYFANSFARYRAGFSTEAYVGRQWGRYVEQLRQCAQTLAFDLVSYQDFLATNAGWPAYRDDPAQYGGFVNQAAMSLVADAFVGQMTMPEMGLHRPVRTSLGPRLVTPNFDTNTGFPITINQGRGFESNYRYDVGYWWYEQLNRVGSYYDKMLALDAFADPELYLIGRDTPTDLRLFQLSFYSMYPAQTIRLFGGILSEDYDDYAPIVSLGGDHAVRRTHLATLHLPPGTGPGRSGRVIDGNNVALDPQAHFTVQLRAAVAGVAEFPATFDQRFMDYARVWADGSSESITVADPARNTVAFTDPWTGVTYRALHVGTGPGESGADVGASALVHPSTGTAVGEAGIGARMLLRLADLDALRLQALARNDASTAASLRTEEQRYLDLLHVVRRLTAVFGTGRIITE